FEGQIEDIIDSYFGDEATAVYPNPFTEWINVKFSSASGEQLVIEVMDLRGKVMAREVYRVSEDGLYSLDIPDNVRPGIYIVIIKQGEKVEFLRAVRK
ncbi:MAG TPA: T9SS type A sorting domain-containing protein, partial [Chryseosolibacter sp.]